MNFFDFLSDSINVCPFAKKIVSAEENTQPEPWVDVVFFFFDFIT